MHCVQCGETLPEDGITCPTCGTVVPDRTPVAPSLPDAPTAQAQPPLDQPVHIPQVSSWEPGLPPLARKKSKGLVVLLIVLVVLLLAGGGTGAAVYVATRPQPVIHVSSVYMAQTLPAGSVSTTFTLSGQKFSGNSDITVLLDSRPVPGVLPIRSDSNGKVAATLTVTGEWATGRHTLTAKDAAGHLTRVGEQIIIVVPGQAHTPGPNGAPSDDASGRIAVIAHSGDVMTLTVTGAANGGTVCGDADDGRPRTQTGQTSGISYIETVSFTCSGSYKGGRVTYTKTATSDTIQYSNGVHCVVHTPYTAVQLQGTFTGTTSVSGTLSHDTVGVTCDHGVGSFELNSAMSTWTGGWDAGI